MAFVMTGKRKIRHQESHRSLRSRIADISEIPKDAAFGLPVLTLTGQTELHLENYRGILEYHESLIRVQTKTGQIKISGHGLQIDYFRNDEMDVKGSISSVEYQVGRDHHV